MSNPNLKKSQKQLESLEEERMHDVRLLLNHLFKSQEVTVKLILDCLYDVGSVNLINQRFRSRSLNTLGKAIARMSKPTFRIFALRWIHNNCPQLIADWLHSQVAFPKLQEQQPVSTAVVAEVQPYSLSEVELNNKAEIKRLRSQVKYLAGITIGTLATLASTVIWVSSNPQLKTFTSQSTSVLDTCVPSAEVERLGDRTLVK